ncbi:INO80 complex subunit B-like [Liolophura sinensis]|uniref:INO80 complex subunit B-like n=1 Tax=Liolophura sinensis TaxID=3198878 RepID=UPI003159214F
MGKRKEGPVSSDEEAGDDSSSHSPHKKHKKHKKKHKKRKSDEHSGPLTYSASPCSEGKSTIKLKIKIGGETLGTKSVAEEVFIKSPSKPAPAINVTDNSWEDDDDDGDVDVDTGTDDHKKNLEESDEEKWLDALEKGELDDCGELKKMKDPALLTARQKALLHGKQDKDLLQLPSGYKVTELTEEQIQRRQQRAKKRRQQAQEKREKDKKQTIDRLLKKQATKGKGPKNKSRRANIPRFCYRNMRDSITISIPQGYNVPILTQPLEPHKVPPSKVTCGVAGCKNLKKYSCSKTGVPLCGLECYKKNLSSQGNMTRRSSQTVAAVR